jgi:23S rRNA G2445 N2-methylase RlmL
MESLWAARAALRFGFPLPAAGAGRPELAALEPPGRALVAAITSAEAERVFRAFTRGPVRYRIEWSGAGHRRGLTFRAAEAARRLRPALRNDPTGSLWEVEVREEAGRFTVELWPRGLPDPRFAYRVAQLPASSHPTVAAALAHVGEARADDIVWDPFVGAGTELVERARLGPVRRLFGTDLDAGALEVAGRNLAAASVQAELAVADARTFRPPLPPTLILSNPPLGRRVLSKERTGELFEAFLRHAARLLAPGGRLVWMSTRPRDTARLGRALGLRERVRQRVDMAGFWADLERWDKI